MASKRDRNFECRIQDEDAWRFIHRDDLIDLLKDPREAEDIRAIVRLVAGDSDREIMTDGSTIRAEQPHHYRVTIVVDVPTQEAASELYERLAAEARALGDKINDLHGEEIREI